LADDETPVEEDEPEPEPLPDADDDEGGLEPEPLADAEDDEGGLEPEPLPDGDDDEGELEPESETGPVGEDAFSVEGLMEALNKVKVSELLLSTVSTLASLAYGKLEAPDLPEAKAAIDAIGALLPLLEGEVDAGMLRDFGQALTNLRLAYADAVAQGQ
jgi:hypothetical protein